MDRNKIIQEEILRLSVQVASLRLDLRESLIAGTPLALLQPLMSEICICQEKKFLLQLGRYHELPYNVKLLYKKPVCFENVVLTEEYLLELKFISNPYRDIYYLSDFVLEIDKTKGFLEVYYKNIKIEFVDQLQKIFFLKKGYHIGNDSLFKC